MLARIRRQLVGGRYRPLGFERVYLKDPKRRVIARAPIEDRVVHTALVMLMEPVLTRGLMPDAFACRPGFGTFSNVTGSLRAWSRNGPGNASSVASLLLTTEAMVAEKPKKETAPPPMPGGGGMGGMGGMEGMY